jgi:type IV pilus assembly protein PilB
MDRVEDKILADYRQIFVNNSHLLDEATFDRTVEIAKESNLYLESLLIEKSFITPEQFLQLASTYYRLPIANLKVSEVNREAMQFLKSDDAMQLLAIPYDFDDKTMKIAVAHPNHADIFSKIKNDYQLDIKTYISTEQAIRQALILYDRNIEEIMNRIDEEGEPSDSNMDRLVFSIVETAVLDGASDVHIEPFEDVVIVRLRIDGLLKQVAKIPSKFYIGLVSYFKIQSKLKIDETRLPQDGRFNVTVREQEISVRVSLVPALFGEKIVLRILPKQAHLYDLNNLGFMDSDVELIRKNIRRPFGMILVCGPTGSGKTTTLYSFLQDIGMDKLNVVNISTIEDPIEYTIPRVTQIQTQSDIELTFATGLRALLRQDPDIIMVGEIRDEETADIGVRAALVGRLVISSLHTNDAVGAIPRLLDMGVEPYLVSSTLAMVVAQRLARKLCTYCRQSYQLDAETIAKLNEAHNLSQSLTNLNRLGVISSTEYQDLRFYKSVGCVKCDNTGYSGRTGLYEILVMNDEISKSISKNTDTTALKQMAVKYGMKTMFDDGLAKVTLGVIDLKELLRVVYS